MTGLCRAMVLALLGGLALESAAQSPPAITVGSKKFTESVILGEVLAHLARDCGVTAEHRAELGGTRILWNALCNREIDAYVEYSGTLREEILSDRSAASEAELDAALASSGLRRGGPLGFNNTYALGMRRDRAAALGLSRISELAARPELRFGLTNEFLDRADGWPALRLSYGLPQRDVRGLDHELAYRALRAGEIDVVDLYSTDAEIRHYDLLTLVDDLGCFPDYAAVVLYRAELDATAPAVLAAWRRLEGALTADRMIALNARARLERVPESQVAAEFVRAQLQIVTRVTRDDLVQRLWQRTREHLRLVLISLAAAMVTAIPLGIVCYRAPRAGQVILACAGLIQTIPALALLVLLMGPLSGLAAALPALAAWGVAGIGDAPAIVALFLYSLLPIVRNTHAGLSGIPASLRESALALGLAPAVRLLRIELPLAARSILAGIKIAAVLCVGFATLGALIGAGGYGQPILTGIRLDRYDLILEGALPAGGLALLMQAAFELLERLCLPRGLRSPMAR